MLLHHSVEAAGENYLSKFHSAEAVPYLKLPARYELRKHICLKWRGPKENEERRALGRCGWSHTLLKRESRICVRGEASSCERAHRGGGVEQSCLSYAERDREASAGNSLSLWCCGRTLSQAGDHTCQDGEAGTQLLGTQSYQGLPLLLCFQSHRNKHWFAEPQQCCLFKK